jgi:hypothetical protein
LIAVHEAPAVDKERKADGDGQKKQGDKDEGRFIEFWPEGYLFLPDVQSESEADDADQGNQSPEITDMNIF